MLDQIYKNIYQKPRCFEFYEDGNFLKQYLYIQINIRKGLNFFKDKRFGLYENKRQK